MNFSKFNAEESIMNISLELYKDSSDEPNEFSVYISHDGSSGYSENGLTKFSQVGDIINQYLEDNLD